MLLRMVYIVQPGWPTEEIALPLEVSLSEGVCATLDTSEQLDRLVLLRSVDPAKLEVVENSGWSRQLPGGEQETLPRLRLRGDEQPEQILVGDLVSAVTFLTDAPLSVSRREDRYVAETDRERELLRRFGTDEPYRRTGAVIRSRTFRGKVDAEGVSALLERSVGLRLYADAVKLSLDVARFGALWRVLESAFARTDRDLVSLLEAYAPARSLGFDESELQNMLTLRGRAGHAQSKSGLRELLTVEGECKRRVTRLKNLVERVILTKKTWGRPTTGVDELASLQAYVGPNGEQVIFQPPASS